MSDLLPINASKQERDLSLTVERSSALPVLIRELWNPATCPANALAWLGWALNVDTWDAGWTETQKRQVIAQSVNVHRVKGTVGAVKRSANSFGATVAITEWHQTNPVGPVHTFSMALSVPNASPEQVDSIVYAITSVKPVRSQLTFSISENAELPMALPIIVRAVVYHRFQASLN